MTMSLDQLEAEAPALPSRDRAHLAHRLIASLGSEENSDESAAEVERAWDEEIGRRVEAFRSGAVQATPASDVFARARDQLR